MDILISVIIGAVSGWLAGAIMRSKSTGVLLNIILGISGGFVGNWLLGVFDISASSGWKGVIITSTIGAIVLIVAGRMIFKQKPRKRR
jgi:uncharacterized membrane protein YeaQ/YmgE (transglycosylase-associated protein family)